MLLGGCVCVLAAPPRPTLRDADEATTPHPSVTPTQPTATTTMDPAKEARILHELTNGGGQTVEEVKNVRKLLAKSSARQAAKHAEKQAGRSAKEVAAEAKQYLEQQQWEQRRQQVSAQQKQGATRHQPSIPELNKQAGLNSFLYEGDIKLTERQAAHLLDLDAEDKAIAAGNDSTVEPTGEPVPVAVKRGWKGGPVRSKRQVVISTSNSFLTWPVADVYYAYDNSVCECQTHFDYF